MQTRRGFLASCGTLAIAAGLGLVGCGSTSSTSAATTEAASEAATTDVSADITELVVGFDQAYPPYGFIDDSGEFTGFDIDLATAVCDANGWDCVLEPIDWDAKDTLLNSGAITCIWNGFTMEGREDDYTFSEPYMLNEQVVVVKADAGIADLAGLTGKNVITQADSAALDVLEGDQAELAATFAALETRPDYNTAFVELESGATDAVACDLSIAAYQIAANPDKYVQLSEALSSEHYAVGFKKGSEALAEKVNESLRELDAAGTVQELCEKYADYGMSYDNWVLE